MKPHIRKLDSGSYGLFKDKNKYLPMYATHSIRLMTVYAKARWQPNGIPKD